MVYGSTKYKRLTLNYGKIFLSALNFSGNTLKDAISVIVKGKVCLRFGCSRQSWCTALTAQPSVVVLSSSQCWTHSSYVLESQGSDYWTSLLGKVNSKIFPITLGSTHSRFNEKKGQRSKLLRRYVTLGSLPRRLLNRTSWWFYH